MNVLVYLKICYWCVLKSTMNVALLNHMFLSWKKQSIVTKTHVWRKLKKRNVPPFTCGINKLWMCLPGSCVFVSVHLLIYYICLKCMHIRMKRFSNFLINSCTYYCCKDRFWILKSDQCWRDVCICDTFSFNDFQWIFLLPWHVFLPKYKKKEIEELYPRYLYAISTVHNANVYQT